MPKTLTIDGIQALRLQLVRNSSGAIEVFAEYALSAGGQPVKLIHQEITAQLTGARRDAARALFEALTQELTALELA